MKRIWNALRYGDWETKKCIGSVIIFSLLGIVCIVCSVVLMRFSVFMMGLIFGVIAIMVSQTFVLEDDDFVAEIDATGKKDTVRVVSVKKNGVSSKNKSSVSMKGEQEQTILDKNSAMDETKQEKRVTDFSRYNSQVLKKVKRKYHVRKDHRPVLIDHSVSYGIKECPAFIWRVHNKVYLLLLEEEPRRICISRDLILHVDYVPNVRANLQNEYLAFQKESMITSVFESHLPDYYDSKAADPDLKYKNLYQIYPDIRFSNRSIYQVMDLLYLNFMPDDKLTQSDKVNGFFKRIYAANILYKDKVYSISEYKEAVEKALEEMCNSEIPAVEFEITLENLVRSKLISQEYADHYMDIRNKMGRKTVAVTYRR